MIYDRNQIRFNVVFVIIVLSSLALNVYFSYRVRQLNSNYEDMVSVLEKIESNQDFNFIQGTHYDLKYALTESGLVILSSNDIGALSGSSMQPVIFDGNILIEKKYDGENLEEGQIVRFIRKDGAAVVHRVRADYGSTLYVQGDSLKEGEVIDKKQVTHIVIGVLFT